MTAMSVPTETVTLPVEGMTCAACQATVQRALSTQPGVTKAAVNLMMNEATVHFDPAATSPGQLVAAINDTGYVSRLPVAADATSSADDQREQQHRREPPRSWHEASSVQPAPARRDGRRSR